MAEAVVDVDFDIHNRTSKKSPEIEAIYLQTGPGWTFKQGSEECPKVPSESNPSHTRHFIKSPVARLSPGAWAQLRLIGRKTVWTKWSGEEAKNTYNLNGYIKIDIFTSEGTYQENVDMSVEVMHIPF
jgi:hypothetical protein